MVRKEMAIPIWKAVDKFDNPSRAIYGERLLLAVTKPKDRKNYQLVFKRQFKDFFEWNNVDEMGYCKITINRKFLERLVNGLIDFQKALYGESDGRKNKM